MNDRIMSSLWDNFITYDNFLLAWQRLANVSSRMILDDLGTTVFAFNLHEGLSDLINKVSNTVELYHPLPDNKVYIPKPSTTMRTMSMLSVPDLIVYQAMANIIANTSHTRLVTHENQHIWGNLFAGENSTYMLVPWKKQYNGFVDQIRKLYDLGNTWIAATDIVSFYDTIDHHTLLQFVKKYCGNNNRFASLLEKCLTAWASHNIDTTMSRGIPQGSNASDYLANLYLYEIDQHMIAKGYHYVRYVDDIRILGKDKSTVQRGLIEFDLELKKYGLVAQVHKTTVHQIEDVEKEITRLKFWVTDPDQGVGVEHTVNVPGSEQASSINDSTEASSNGNTPDPEDMSAESIQHQLYIQFLEAYENLDDPQKDKEANTKITYCLNRLFRRDDLREKVLTLLDRTPWRSETVTQYLALYDGDPVVIDGLASFIRRHDVYYWHRANALEALAKIAKPIAVAPICRGWLTDQQQDWYTKTVAAKILGHVRGQHSFLVECLRREQQKNRLEHQAILRQQLAYAAFSTTSNRKKHSTLFDMLLSAAENTLLRRLAIYLIQQPSCKVGWDDIKKHHSQLGEYGDLIEQIGISPNVPRPCFIRRSIKEYFEVETKDADLRPMYGPHYNKAMVHLGRALEHFYSSKDDFIHHFHPFCQLTLLAFHETIISQPGATPIEYGDLWQHTGFRSLTPKGNKAWEELGELRKRVDHPVDKKTRLHTTEISSREIRYLKQQMSFALQELFDVWSSTPPSSTT